jgi:hypothetical protein
MKAMELALRRDLVTTSDLRAEIAGVRTEIAGVRAEISDTRAAFEEKLRAQTWTIVGVFAVLGALTVTLSQLG